MRVPQGLAAWSAAVRLCQSGSSCADDFAQIFAIRWGTRDAALVPTEISLEMSVSLKMAAALVRVVIQDDVGGLSAILWNISPLEGQKVHENRPWDEGFL